MLVDITWRKISALLACLLLSSCVGGTLGNHSDIEEYPLRGASEREAVKLKRCLRAAFAAQQARKAKTGSFYKRASDLPVDAPCQGLLLAHNRTQDGFEIMAQFHQNESTVRWTINQDGVIEEHLGPEMDPELEF